MYLHVEELINEIAVDEPDPASANALQEGLALRRVSSHTNTKLRDVAAEVIRTRRLPGAPEL